MSSNDNNGRLAAVLDSPPPPVGPTQPRHRIEPLFGFVEFRNIFADPSKPWFTRDQKTFEDKLGSEEQARELLAENIEKEGVIEPLHVLYCGYVDPCRWENKLELAKDVETWQRFDLALGFRRYKAIELAIERGYVDPDFRVPVRIYLRDEIKEKIPEESLEHFLTKAAVSSNVFFKAYTTVDKIRITRTLIEQIRASGGTPRHRDILHLLGIKHSESAAEHRASLRRFAVCNDDTIFAAHTGIDKKCTHNPKAEILTFSIAEHLANRLGRSPSLIQTFLNELQAELDQLRGLKRNARRKDEAGVKLSGYDSRLYCRWIDNLRMFGESKAESLTPSTYSYQIVVKNESSVSVPGVSINLKDTTPEGFAQLIDIYFKLKALADRLREEIVRVCPYDAGSRRNGENRDGLSIPPIGYGEEYKKFIRKLRLEQYANVDALRRLYGLDKSLNWVLRETLEEHTGDWAGDLPDNEAVPFLLQKHSLVEENVGEELIRAWVIKKVVEENKNETAAEEKEKELQAANNGKVIEFLKIVPLMTGTLGAYARSLDSFGTIRGAVRSLGNEIGRVASKAGFGGFDVTGITSRIDKAAKAVEAFTPDRETAVDIVKVLEEHLKRVPEQKPETRVSKAESTSSSREEKAKESNLKASECEEADDQVGAEDERAGQPSSGDREKGGKEYPELLENREVQKLAENGDAAETQKDQGVSNSKDNHSNSDRVLSPEELEMDRLLFPQDYAASTLPDSHPVELPVETPLKQSEPPQVTDDDDVRDPNT